jgi:hypothetical protein
LGYAADLELEIKPGGLVQDQQNIGILSGLEALRKKPWIAPPSSNHPVISPASLMAKGSVCFAVGASNDVIAPRLSRKKAWLFTPPGRK